MKTSFTVVVVAIVFSLFLTGCSTTQSPSTTTDDAASSLSPTETVEVAMTALKESDTKTFNQYIQHTAGSDKQFVENKLLDDNLDVEGKKFVDAVVTNFAYEVVEQTEDGDNATVQVKFTNSDLSGVMGQLVSRAMQEKSESEDAKLNQLILDAATDGEAVTTTASLKLVKIDDAWKIIMDDESMNAICGGLFSGVKEFD